MKSLFQQSEVRISGIVIFYTVYEFNLNRFFFMNKKRIVQGSRYP